MQETIYVRLLNENIDVWRPVLAVKRSSPNSFLILEAPSNIVPDTEIWEFTPGTLVIVVPKVLEGKRQLVAMEAFGN